MNVKWKLSISASDNVGGRDYMEDYYCVHIEEECEKNVFALFGVFDGHGGHQAANYVKQNIVNELKSTEQFWSNDDDDIKFAIKLVFRKMQNLLWIQREFWPNTLSGYKSTAGTTASIAVIKNNKIFIGHVGDSGILLLTKRNDKYSSKFLTKEHKPDNNEERRRVVHSGGLVMRRAGAERVVWSRLKKAKSVNEEEEAVNKNNSPNHDYDQNELCKNQPEQQREYIPFLAVTRSLGDLWSYDPCSGRYHVSPDPDIECVDLCSDEILESESIRYEMVLASDGLWSVMNEYKIEDILSQKNEFNGATHNPASLLVANGLDSWQSRGFLADNICVIHVSFEAACLSDFCNLQDTTHISSNGDNNYPFNCILELNLPSDYSRPKELITSTIPILDNYATLKFNLLKDLVINYLQNPQNDFKSDIKLITDLSNCIWTHFFHTISSSQPVCQHRSDYDFFNLSPDDSLLPSIPELATKLEIHFPLSTNLYQTLISLPWIIDFISLMKAAVTHEMNDFLLLFPNIDGFFNLSLFSSFWLKFYNKFLSQHNSDDEASRIQILRSTLQSQSHQVNVLINPYLPISIRPNIQLKRAKSTTNHVSNSDSLTQQIIIKPKIRKCSSQNHLYIKTNLHENDEVDKDDSTDDGDYPSGHTTPLLLSPQNNSTVNNITSTSGTSSNHNYSSYVSSTSSS